jgi:hypothetical protein
MLIQRKEGLVAVVCVVANFVYSRFYTLSTDDVAKTPQTVSVLASSGEKLA